VIPRDFITEWRKVAPWADDAQVEQDLVLSRAVESYLRHDGATVSRAEFEANLLGKLADPRFASDLSPLLATGISWDPAAAGGMVLDQLVSRLKGSPWRGRP